ncbi:uncharacterized protein LOC131678627 [Topomyia yanbarensis]|uniref:uncharacterized protein LOC131678627 n=1 Tax=Topomyia yanbarensis TaxID=2498891 RepID=UPI00273BEFAE|nr:uncharacterized protein LOC131678627 [Topomyia yanbarensis]
MPRRPPPDWGGEPPLSRSLPGYMNSGDVIDQQTLLLRAIDEPGNTEQRLPADPFLILKSVQAVLETDPRNLVSATKEAKGYRYVLRTRSKKTYIALQKMNQLIGGQKVEIIPHPTLNIVQGVIYDPDTKDVEEARLLEELKTQGVTNVRRITKMVDKKPTNTPLVILSFSGSILPEHVYIGLLRTSIRPYYPLPMMCFKCGHFGHGSRLCPNPAVCLNCSQQHETSKENPCVNTSLCINCGQGHSTRSRECPKFIEEEMIIKAKIDNNITYPEARALITKRSQIPTYASTIKGNTKNDEKDTIIAQLQKELATLKESKAQSAEDNKDQVINILKEHCAKQAKQLQAASAEIAKLRQAVTELYKHQSAHPSENTNENAFTGTKAKKGKFIEPTSVAGTSIGPFSLSEPRRSNRQKEKDSRKSGTDKSRSPNSKATPDMTLLTPNNDSAMSWSRSSSTASLNNLNQVPSSDPDNPFTISE